MEPEDLKVTELDRITCNYNLQMLKASLSYLPPSGRRLLSIWIKLRELRNTVRVFETPDADELLSACNVSEAEPKRGFFDVLNEIKDYGSPEQRQTFDRFSQMIQMISLYEQMNQAAPPEKERAGGDTKTASGGESLLEAASLSGAPSEAPEAASSQADPSDFRAYVRKTLPPEKRQLFDTYTTLFGPLIGKKPD